MRLSDLQHKDVINISDGKLVGNIIDVIINSLNGNMEKLVIEKNRFFVSLFSNKNEIEIKWEQIEKIGEDVILVSLVGEGDYQNTKPQPRQANKNTVIKNDNYARYKRPSVKLK